MQYLDIGLNVILSIFDWYTALDLHYKFLTPLLALFVMHTVTRFLIMPVLGASAGAVGSDVVKRNRSNSNKSNSRGKK